MTNLVREGLQDRKYRVCNRWKTATHAILRCDGDDAYVCFDMYGIRIKEDTAASGGESELKRFVFSSSRDRHRLRPSLLLPDSLNYGDHGYDEVMLTNSTNERGRGVCADTSLRVGCLTRERATNSIGDSRSSPGQRF